MNASAAITSEPPRRHSPAFSLKSAFQRSMTSSSIPNSWPFTKNSRPFAR